MEPSAVLVRDVAVLLAGAVDVDLALPELLGLLGRSAGARRVRALLLDDGGHELVPTHNWTAPDVSNALMGLDPLPVESFPAWMPLLRRQRVVTVTDVQGLGPRHAAERDFLLALGVSASMVAPVHGEEGLAALVMFDDPEPAALAAWPGTWDGIGACIGAALARRGQLATQAPATGDDLRYLQATGRLFKGLSLQFNSLLSVVINGVQMAEEDLPADDEAYAMALTCLRDVLVASGRAQDLVRRMTMFARAPDSDTVPLDLARHLRRMEPTLQAELGVKHVLRTELGRNLPPLLADPDQLERLMVDLARNARLAMDEPGVLLVRATSLHIGPGETGPVPDLGPGTWIRIRVQDTGRGMDPLVAARAFEPFFTTRAADRAWGLGLPTVYAICASLRGQLTLETRPGNGCTVTLYLPATPQRRVDTTSSRLAVVGGAPVGPRALVVEPEPSLCTVARRILEHGGYRVVAASHPALALMLGGQAQEPLDLLVTGLTLEGVAGTEFAAGLRKLNPNMAVVYLGREGEAVPEDGAYLPVRELTVDTLLAKAGGALGGAQSGEAG